MKLTDKQMKFAVDMIGAVETGGQILGKQRYDDFTEAYTNSNAEYSITIGAFQFFQESARELLLRIKSLYPAVFSKYDNAGIAIDIARTWSKSNPYNIKKTSAKAKAIVNIISSPEGKKVQDLFIEAQIKSYINYAEGTLGVTNLQCLLFCAECIHLGGNGPIKRVVNRASNKNNLNSLYNSLMLDQNDTSSDNQIGDKKFKTRHDKCKKWIEENIIFSSNSTENKEDVKMAKTRMAVVNLVNSWVGKNEADGSYKSIIDEYNKVGPFPRNVKMQYDWAWCAATWSALAKKLGYTDIMPVEISCYYIIERAKEMGVWVEQDSYVPKLGDAVLYDWQDSGNGDNTGTPDHIGTVTYVNESAGTFVVTEGNYSNAVKKRTMSINGRYIRGFITPKYDATGITETTTPTQQGGKSIETVAREVIAGQWGTGEARKTALKNAGYDYNTVQAKVNEILNGSATKPTTTTPTTSTTTKKVASDYATKFDKNLKGAYKTTSALYMRNGAGTNKKAMVVIPKGTTVQCYGYYTPFNGTKWLYIQVTLDGVQYTGFSSSVYLKK